VAGVLVALLVLVACGSGREPGTSASAPALTSGGEPRDAAVATTSRPARAADAAAPSVPLRGEQLCDLVRPEDLEPLGLAGPGSPAATACSWADPAQPRRLVLATSMLSRPPVPAAQDYQLQLGREPVDWLALGDAGLLLNTSPSQTLLVVFAGDLRLEFDVPAARELAVELARAAVGRLGPRRPVAEPSTP
jgi:hypothetical protein